MSRFEDLSMVRDVFGVKRFYVFFDGLSILLGKMEPLSQTFEPSEGFACSRGMKFGGPVDIILSPQLMEILADAVMSKARMRRDDFFESLERIKDTRLFGLPLDKLPFCLRYIEQLRVDALGLIAIVHKAKGVVEDSVETVGEISDSPTGDDLTGGIC